VSRARKWGALGICRTAFPLLLLLLPVMQDCVQGVCLLAGVHGVVQPLLLLLSQLGQTILVNKAFHHTEVVQHKKSCGRQQ
jgi:hypothetical protein